MSDVKKAEDQVSAARQAKRETDRAVSDALATVRAEWRDRQFAAERGVREAEAALAAAKSAGAPDHEWTGKKVFRIEKELTRYSGHPTGKKTRFEGVVETYRPGVSLGRGQYAAIGAPFVRLLKKDGTPGLKTERLNDDGGNPLWTLA